MTEFFDMEEIAKILRMVGLRADCAPAGGEQFCIFVGELLDEPGGTPRYTVTAGPGTEAMLDGVYGVYGTLDEFGFCQDSDECAPAYAVREHETPARIAERIITLHQHVEARRQARRDADPEDLVRLPLIADPIPGEDVHVLANS